MVRCFGLGIDFAKENEPGETPSEFSGHPLFKQCVKQSDSCSLLC